MEKIKDMLVAIFTHKRMKSFYWRTLDMGVVALADVSVQIFTDFNIPNWITLGVGLVLGEITKALNKK